MRLDLAGGERQEVPCPLPAAADRAERRQRRERDARRADPGQRRLARGERRRHHRGRQSERRRELRRARPRHRGGRRCGGRGGARGARWRLGPDARVRARPHPRPARPAGARAGGRARPARGAGRRQAAPPGQGRRAGAGALLRVLRRRGRQGARHHDPLSRRLHGLDPARAARRHRPHHPVELPDADPRAQRRRGARHGQRLRAQAGRGRVAHRARGRPARARGGAAAGRPQHRAGLRRGGGCCARRASRHRPRLVHRLARGRLPGPAGGGAARLPGDARARRQVAPAGVRRRRPRPGAAVHRQRRDPERRPDLLGRLAPPGRGPRLRRRSSARWPSASIRSTSARPSATSTAGR